jgi:mRNA interferase MazF
VKEGDIVLAILPQADGTSKNRPTVLLREMPGFGDLLVCGVSTQLRQQVIDFDEIIVPSDSDFKASGLKSPSLIRLGYLAALPASGFLGRIGSISSERHQRLLTRLSDYLRPKP